jgi:hypothetical protein
MSDLNPPIGADGLPEVLVSGKPPVNPYYDVNKILSHSFLKSAKFCVQIPVLTTPVDGMPSIAGANEDIPSEEFTFLCDSVEFPGQTLTTSEFRMPGKLKLKVPYLRELNEVTLTFYHNNKLPMYRIFSDWISGASPTNTTNRYFDELVCPKIKLIQFDEVAGVRGFIRDIFDFSAQPLGGSTVNLSKYMTVNLLKAYPLNFASMPANWADDGFHKMTVSFFYENLLIEQGIKNLTFQDLLDNGNIFDNSPAIRNPRPSLDFVSNNSGIRSA